MNVRFSQCIATYDTQIFNCFATFSVFDNYAAADERIEQAATVA